METKEAVTYLRGELINLVLPYLFLLHPLVVLSRGIRRAERCNRGLQDCEWSGSLAIGKETPDRHTLLCVPAERNRRGREEIICLKNLLLRKGEAVRQGSRVLE